MKQKYEWTQLVEDALKKQRCSIRINGFRFYKKKRKQLLSEVNIEKNKEEKKIVDIDYNNIEKTKEASKKYCRPRL